MREALFRSGTKEKSLLSYSRKVQFHESRADPSFLEREMFAEAMLNILLLMNEKKVNHNI